MLKNLIEKHSSKSVLLKTMNSGSPYGEAFERLLEIYRELKEFNSLPPSKQDKAKRDEIYKRLEIAEEDMIDVDKGLYIGYGVDLLNDKELGAVKPIYLNWADITNHFQVFGTTRQGKTRLMVHIAKQIMLKGDNQFKIEPKGSIGQELLAYDLENAYKADRLEDVVYISVCEPTLSLKLNPLHLMTDEEIASHIVALIKSTATVETSSEMFFSRTVYKIVLTILKAMRFKEEIDDVYETKRKQAEIEEFIRWVIDDRFRGKYPKKYDKVNNVITPDVVERLLGKNKVNIERDKYFEAHRTLITYKEIAKWSQFKSLETLKEQVSERLLPTENHIDSKKVNFLHELKEEALLMLNDCLKSSPEHFGAISGSLSAASMMLASGSIGEIFCSTRINPLSLMLANPNRGVIGTFQPFSLKFASVADMTVRIFFGMFQSLYARVGATGRGFNRRLYFLIDEGQSVLFPGVENGFNKLAGLGVTFGIFVQSPADYEAKLGSTLARVVSDNINTSIIYKLNDPVSRQIASDMLGYYTKTELDYAQRGELGGMLRVSRTSGNPIVTPDEFARLTVGQAFVTHKNSVFYLRTPYQPDAVFDFDMPETEDEVVTDKLNRKYQDIIENIGKYSEEGGYFANS